jgi:UDP-2,4-diacetamido-2,4,6-trideoxy-beta-L-altropyranose hydrolase
MNLLLRADADQKIGTGHVMRSLALAQAWHDAGGKATFAAADVPSAIRARLLDEVDEVVAISADAGSATDASETAARAAQFGAEWVAVDGYQFGAGYQNALRAAGLKVLFVDDYGHGAPYSAEIVLNQNSSADPAVYHDRQPYTRLLSGPRYCLLRREFRVWRDWNRETPTKCQSALITIGGSDPGNLTERVIEALSLAELDLETAVVVGGGNPHAGAIENAVMNSGPKMKLLQAVTNMADLMAAADVAVSAAGSTCWELCALGLPALLIDVSENQTPLAVDLNGRSCAIHVGNGSVSAHKIADDLRRLCEDHELRQEMCVRSRELVDGEGTRRVVCALRGREFLRLRRVRADDRRLLWEWANDPEVRAASFSQDAIPWEIHVAWFDKKLQQNGSLTFIAEDDQAQPTGQIRFDARVDGDWEIGTSVAKPVRGRGLGSEVIRLGVQEITGKNPRARFHAWVKPANIPSIKAFESASFQRAGIDEVRGHAAIHFVYEKR